MEKLKGKKMIAVVATICQFVGIFGALLCAGAPLIAPLIISVMHLLVVYASYSLETYPLESPQKPKAKKFVRITSPVFVFIVFYLIFIFNLMLGIYAGNLYNTEGVSKLTLIFCLPALVPEAYFLYAVTNYSQKLANMAEKLNKDEK